MLAWLSENLAAVIICAALLVGVAAIIVSMVRGRKKGKSSCGCGCTGCPMGGACHSKNNFPKKPPAA